MIAHHVKYLFITKFITKHRNSQLCAVMGVSCDGTMLAIQNGHRGVPLAGLEKTVPSLLNHRLAIVALVPHCQWYPDVSEMHAAAFLPHPLCDACGSGRSLGDVPFQGQLMSVVAQLPSVRGQLTSFSGQPTSAGGTSGGVSYLPQCSHYPRAPSPQPVVLVLPTIPCRANTHFLPAEGWPWISHQWALACAWVPWTPQ